jgi:Holliday junction resolvase
MIFLTKDGFKVRMCHAHMAQHKDVIPYLDEAIGSVEVKSQRFMKTHIDMGRVVGNTACVTTDETDEIVYAVRVGRPGETRFVKNREMQPSNHVAVILQKQGSEYKLVTAFIGKVAERELFDKTLRTEDERLVAEKFWANHALVWGSQEIECTTKN